MTDLSEVKALVFDVFGPRRVAPIKNYGAVPHRHRGRTPHS